MKESNVFPGSWEMCCTSYLSQCSVPENSGTLYCSSYSFAEHIHFALLPHLSGTSSGILWKGGSIFGDWTHWLGFRICAIGSLVMFMRDRSDSGGLFGFGWQIHRLGGVGGGGISHSGATEVCQWRSKEADSRSIPHAQHGFKCTRTVPEHVAIAKKNKI